MNTIFMRENEKLKDSVMRLAGEVEHRLSDVLKAVARCDELTLQTLEALDEEIDEREVLIEEECLKILALHQPVAKDLRFVVAMLKINNDLERIGDIVVNIAERGVRLIATTAVSDLQEKLMRMGQLAREMLRDSLDALISLDRAKAVEILTRDDALDALNAQVIDDVIARATLAHNGSMTESLILIYGIARDIERIGDHATNIAEDVAYLVDGTIIRHKPPVQK